MTMSIYVHRLYSAFSSRSQQNRPLPVSLVLSGTSKVVAGTVVDVDAHAVQVRSPEGEIAYVRADAIVSYIIKGE